jgi:hypothetical protein
VDRYYSALTALRVFCLVRGAEGALREAYDAMDGVRKAASLDVGAANAEATELRDAADHAGDLRAALDHKVRSHKGAGTDADHTHKVVEAP